MPEMPTARAATNARREANMCCLIANLAGAPRFWYTLLNSVDPWRTGRPTTFMRIIPLMGLWQNGVAGRHSFDSGRPVLTLVHDNVRVRFEISKNLFLAGRPTYLKALDAFGISQSEMNKVWHL